MKNLPPNQAAWLNAISTTLSVRSSPFTPPKANEIVIKVHAWAINPIDWMLQDEAVFPDLVFPLIMGNDVAGTVFSVGASVTRFKTGDRILALAVGGGMNEPSKGGFQEYVVVDMVLAAPIPNGLSFDNAVVLPLGVATAACALFQQDFLRLAHPSCDPVSTGRTILVWGGSSSVGSNAIQLATAAGYEVIAVASASNFPYLKELGASSCYDYHSKTVVEDIGSVIKDTDFAGIFQAAGDAELSVKIAANLKRPVFIASAVGVPEYIPDGVQAKIVLGTDSRNNEVGPLIFEHFLPKALAEGSYTASPEPSIVGNGLKSIQEGLDILRKGVSAKKLVVVR